MERLIGRRCSKDPPESRLDSACCEHYGQKSQHTDGGQDFGRTRGNRETPLGTFSSIERYRVMSTSTR